MLTIKDFISDHHHMVVSNWTDESKQKHIETHYKHIESQCLEYLSGGKHESKES